MNRSQRLRVIFRRFDDSPTLGQLIEATREDGGLAYKLTAAISELRDELEASQPMETVVWRRGKTPSQGVYTILPAEVRNGMVVAIPRQLTFGQLAA